MMKPYKTSDLVLSFLPDGIANLIEGDLRYGRGVRLLAPWESHLPISTFLILCESGAIMFNVTKSTP